MRSLLVLMMLTAPALANPKTKAPEAMHADDCARARKQGKTCVLDMTDEKVQGNAPLATGSGVSVIDPGKQPGLIRLRTGFLVAVIRPAEGREAVAILDCR